MKLGHVHRAYFRGKFGVDIQQRFAGCLSELQDQGFLALDESDVRLNRNGLLQVDRLLHEFFLPQHRQRALCLTFFLTSRNTFDGETTRAGENLYDVIVIGGGPGGSAASGRPRE